MLILTYFLLSESIAGSELSRQGVCVGARLEVLLCGIPPLSQGWGIPDQRTLQAETRMKENVQKFHLKLFQSAVSRNYEIFHWFSCLTEVSSHDCTNNSVSKIMLGAETILIPFNNGTEAAVLSVARWCLTVQTSLFSISVFSRTFSEEFIRPFTLHNFMNTKTSNSIQCHFDIFSSPVHF